MAERKDFVSDGLVTMRHKYVADKLNSRKGADDISASYQTPDVDKNLSMQEQQMQIYHQIRDDLNIRLNKEMAALKSKIELGKQELKNCEAAHDKVGKLLERFSDMPEFADFDENSKTLARIEQLRAEFFSAKAALPDRHEVSQVSNSPAAGSPQISLLPELNSLHQMQMFKMGLFFALPLIIGIIIACGIIAWVMMITMGA